MDLGAFGDDEFTDRLGWILLTAYAEGIEVQGEWMLLDVHEEVPDVVVEVIPAGEPYDAADGGATDSRVVTEFKSELQSFLLEEFGSGTTITGTWQLRFVPENLPAWDVTIRLPDLDEDEDQFLRGLDHS